MRGYKQRFQNGFDNQGLWVEVEVEKELGFKSKKDIEKYGKITIFIKAKTQFLGALAAGPLFPSTKFSKKNIKN